MLLLSINKQKSQSIFAHIQGALKGDNSSAGEYNQCIAHLKSEIVKRGLTKQ